MIFVWRCRRPISRCSSADEGVRIGQDSVKASLVSYRDARARFNAGVNTKLDVLEAETQLARDRNILTTNLRDQNEQRRNLARVLDLPQDVTPTAATPARPLGLWEPSLQESIVAAYNYSEELDQLILDISINNSQANASLAAVQPVVRFVNSTSASRTEGQNGQTSLSDIDMGDFTYGVQNSTALTASWRLFDGGRARAEYKRSKQAAERAASILRELAIRSVFRWRKLFWPASRHSESLRPQPLRFWHHKNLFGSLS